jgi:hypothetical protein
MQPSLGKMSAYKMFNWRDRASSSVEQTVAAFLEVGEAIATRWIQTAKGVLVLQMVPDNGASGAIYVFDRQREQWYMLSFEDIPGGEGPGSRNLPYRLKKLRLQEGGRVMRALCKKRATSARRQRASRKVFLLALTLVLGVSAIRVTWEPRD